MPRRGSGVLAQLRLSPSARTLDHDRGGIPLLTTPAQTLLFLSSFSPLFLMFGVLDSFASTLAQWICFGLAGLSLLGLAVFFSLLRGLEPQSIEVNRARPRDSDAIGYVVTYLIPFLTLNTNDWRGRVAMIVFIAVVAILYIRSHIFYVNPVLSLAGYRLFEIEAGHGFVILITRRKFVNPGSELRARRLSDYVYIEGNDHG
jgi:hypothetical protein